MRLKTWLKNWVEASGEDPLISGLAIDSREVKKGDVFLAYPGFKVDGRNYIDSAIAKGAAAVVYESENFQLSKKYSIPFVPFSGLQNHLGDLAAYFYHDPSREMKVVGVTGTNGKTSCTHFIARALEMQPTRCAVMGTLGYGFLPDLKPSARTTLDAVFLQKIFSEFHEAKTAAVAMEVTSHALDQKRVQGVHFDIAVLTQLSRDHLDYHETMEAYAKAKELLFQQPGLKYGVVNLDDAFGQQIVDKYHQKLKLIGYSQLGQTDKRISVISATNVMPKIPGFTAQVETPWGKGELSTELLGRFNLSNLLAVLGVLGLLEMPLPQALSAIAQLTHVKGRMQCLGQSDEPLIVVDYSHTPDALEKALQSLQEHCHGDLYCVFGCGGDRDRGKRPQMAAIAEKYANHVILTNDNPRTESPEMIADEIKAGFTKPERVTIELDREKAIQLAVQKACVGDIVLIAGKGHETVQIIGDKVMPFDDGEVVLQALKLKRKGS